MRGGPGGPPDEFVAFVARRMGAAGTGVEAPPGRPVLGVDSFGAVARRFWWLRRRAGALDSYLDRVLARADPASEGPELTVGPAPAVGSGFAVRSEVIVESAHRLPVGARETADRAWLGATRTRRHQLVVAAVVVLIGLALVAAPRGGSAAAGSLPTVRNALVDLVRPNLPRLAVPGLPASIDLLSGKEILPLADRPVRRAVAIIRQAGQNTIYVLGDDGIMRSFAPPTPYQIVSTSLSPSGTQAAFIAESVRVVDLTTGTTRDYAGPAPVTSLAWLAEDVLLVGSPTRSATVNLSTGAVISTGLTAGDVLQGAPVTELVGWPGRLVRPPVDGGKASTVRLFAPTGSAFLPEWLGGFVGVGRLAPTGLAVRDADATRLPLPAADGRAWYGAVAVDPAIGAILRVLVNPDDPLPLPVLGFISDRMILFQAGHQIICWDPRSGDVRLVTKLTQTMAVAIRIG
jgi:hypothetical protein